MTKNLYYYIKLLSKKSYKKGLKEYNKISINKCLNIN
jgi:hypothetical protein